MNTLVNEFLSQMYKVPLSETLDLPSFPFPFLKDIKFPIVLLYMNLSFKKKTRKSRRIYD